MYIHLGAKKSIRKKDIIAIVNLEATMVSRNTLDFLHMAEEEGFIEVVSRDIPKAAVITEGHDGQSKVYLTNVATATIRKRFQKGRYA